MEPVAGVGDVTCSLLLPVSVLLAKQKYCRFEFHFSRLFFQSFVHQFMARTTPKESEILMPHVESCFCNVFKLWIALR